jgi:hypothetical protein
MDVKLAEFEAILSQADEEEQEKVLQQLLHHIVPRVGDSNACWGTSLSYSLNKSVHTPRNVRYYSCSLTVTLC